MDYNDYLGLDTLLNNQNLLSKHINEESTFIIVHQASELWLKRLILETISLRKNFETKSRSDIIYHFTNMTVFMNLISTQLSCFRTLTFEDFSKFRNNLGNSSGKQSIQFKALNSILGLHMLECDDMAIIARYPYLQEAIGLKSVKSLFIDFFLDYDDIIGLYKSDMSFKLLCDNLFEFDKAYMYFKREHLSMVRFMIGDKIGSGDTDRNFLSSRIENPIFQKIWDLINK